MWRNRWLENAFAAGSSFGNPRVFDTIQMQNPEFVRLIIYLPLREYIRRRFIPVIESIGPAEFIAQLQVELPGQRSSFSRENRVLSFLTGLRETGQPILPGTSPSGRKVHSSLSVGNQLYIHNFLGSGLDKMNMPNARNGILDRLDPALASEGGFSSQVVVDDEVSIHRDNPLMIYVNQRYLRTIFNAYLDYQLEQHLSNMNLESMNRLTRFFWRSLAFGAPGGNEWRNSARGGHGLATMKNLMDLLGFSYRDVPKLWQQGEIQRAISLIEDSERTRLASLARLPNDYGEIAAIREAIPIRIAAGLRHANYFQAMKISAIADGLMTTIDNGNFR